MSPISSGTSGKLGIAPCGDEQRCGGVGTDAQEFEKGWRRVCREPAQFFPQGLDLDGELMTTARERPQGVLGYRRWSCEFARTETGTVAHEFAGRDPAE